MFNSFSYALKWLIFICAGIGFLVLPAAAQNEVQQRMFRGLVLGVDSFQRGALRSDDPELAAYMAMKALSQIEYTYAAAIRGEVTIEQHLLYRSSADIPALRQKVISGWHQDISDRMIKRYTDGCRDFMRFHAGQFNFDANLPDKLHAERMRPFDIAPSEGSTYYVMAISDVSPHPMEAYEIASDDLEGLKGSMLTRGIGFQTFFQIERLERFVAPDDRAKIKGTQYFVGIYEDVGEPLLDLLKSAMRAPDVSYCFLY